MTEPSSSPVATAFSFPEVLVVEASAGSGKTYALAKRYVQLLLMQQPQELPVPSKTILALTFTNKAAFEMKARILHFLKGIALGRLPHHDLTNIIEPLQLSPEQAAQRAFHVMDSIIHHYHFFQVQTIDKFINTLLSGCAFKVGLTSSFKIKTTAYEYLEYSLDRLIDQAVYDEELRQVFEGFLDNYLYLENRTGWFPKKDMLDVVKGLYGQNNHYGCPFMTSGVAAGNLRKAKHRLLEKIKALAPMLPEKTNARFRKSLDQFIKRHDYTFDIDSLPNFSTEDPPLNKGALASEDIFSGWRDIQKDIHSICLQEAYSLYNPYIEVFERVMDAFALHAAADDVLFLEELNKKAQKLFDAEGITVEELYFRLATRIQHFLLDEFQDTSRLQWLNLKMMPEEALATGGSLFYVGDRKQAIYGFRGGDVRLFDEIHREYTEYARVESLSNNFRSQRAIVAFNNLIFSQENIRHFVQAKEQRERAKKDVWVEFHGDEYRRLDNVFASAQQTFQPDNTDGYVEVERIADESNSERLEHTQEYLLETLREVSQRFEWRDVAILTRENLQVETVTHWLLEVGIPVDSERTSNIKDNDRIQELLCLLSFLNSPLDNVAFAGFILGDIFVRSSGIDEEDLRSFVFHHREDLRRRRDFYLYQAFRKTYPHVWDEFIGEIYQNVGLYPLYELVITIYERLGCIHHFPDDHGFFMLFLELIKKREEEHCDIVSFLEYFDELRGEELYAHMPGLNAVKILTVHKSKGLEFPVVILPFLKINIKVGGKTSDAAQSYLLKQAENGLRLLRLKKIYYKYAEELYRIYRDEYVDAFISELNNVYVALTRASHEMYICLPQKAGQGFNLANHLIPEDFLQSGERCAYPLQRKEEQQHLLPLDRAHHQDWITYLNDEHLAYQHVDQYQSRLTGIILHAILAQISCRRIGELEEALSTAINTVRREYPDSERVDGLTDRVGMIVHHADLQPFFVVKSGDVFMEREVVDRFGHTKRIDRLIVTDTEVVVIDYKSSTQEQSAGAEQVRYYMEIMSVLYPDHRIRGYLMYMDSLNLEEIHG